MAGEIDTAHMVRVKPLKLRTAILFNLSVILCGCTVISQTSLEAQYLANQVQLYYGSQDTERYALLRQFNHEPESFDHRRLLEQLEGSSVSTGHAGGGSNSSDREPTVGVQSSNQQPQHTPP